MRRSFRRNDLTVIRELFQKKSSGSLAGHLKFIVMRRNLPDFIPGKLSTFPRIRLDLDSHTDIALNSDINRFVDVKVDELAAYKQFPKPLVTHVKEVFQSRAQITFLWVGIVSQGVEKI